MKLILSPEQMNHVDEYAIKKLRMSSLHLMENAGNAIVHEIVKRVAAKTTKRILIVCGKGNNGGDGFVAARFLLEKGMNVTVALIESETKLSGDALKNYQRLHDYKIAQLKIIRFEQLLKQRFITYDIIIDAMLGTSFRGELTTSYSKAVEWCNKQSSIKIAVDIPTGLNGETGEIGSNAFYADATVTMSNPKIGFYNENAKACTGEVIVANIGIPKIALDSIIKSKRQNIVIVEESDVQKDFPKRPHNSHKHSVGKIFALAGSKGMMGAALLCSQSAMRTGAGQVILGIPDSEYSIIAKRTVEVMPLGLPSTTQGSLSLDANREINKRIAWSTVVLVGCGLSHNVETQQLIREIIQRTEKPMVIDADGLNALVGNLQLLKNKRSKQIIITPHRGEFSRLIGVSSTEIEKNKYLLAANFAKEYHVILVLKGAPTITATPNGKIFVNSTGNPGMSTAGSGDVLTGIIASLIGQGNSGSDAALNGVFLHGRAGDLAAKQCGMHGMIATDIVKKLPEAITSLFKI